MRKAMFGRILCWLGLHRWAYGVTELGGDRVVARVCGRGPCGAVHIESILRYYLEAKH